jgi:Flp pilus assembly protein TadD
VLANSRRWADALRLLGPYVAGAPDDATAWCLVAQCRLGLDDPALALDAAGRAAALNPDSEWAHRLRAMALSAMHASGPAREAAQEAVRLAPNLWQTWVQRAEVDANADDVDESSWDAARRAVELAPLEPSTHITVGRVALAAKQNRFAVQAFREALRLDPTSATAQNNLAVAALRRKRIAFAGSLLVNALRANPTSALYAANLRIVLTAWAAVLDLIGVVACLVVLNTTDGRDLPAASPGPITVTLPDQPARSVVTFPSFSPPTVHVPATGHPGVLTGAAVVLLAAICFIVLTVRRSIGARAGPILLASMRVDRSLQLTVLSCAVAVSSVFAAAIVGLPRARGILGLALVLNVGAGLLTRWLRRSARRTATPRH